MKQMFQAKKVCWWHKLWRATVRKNKKLERRLENGSAKIKTQVKLTQEITKKLCWWCSLQVEKQKLLLVVSR